MSLRKILTVYFGIDSCFYSQPGDWHRLGRLCYDVVDWHVILCFENIYYIPIYFQYVKGYSSLVSGALVLAYTFPGAFWSMGSGVYVSKTNHYKRVITVGAAIWTLSLGLQIRWATDTSLGELLGVLEVNSIAVGFSLQTTLVAALATTPSKDRAVVTAGRNFFRTLGASFGLAMANAIYQGTVTKQLSLVTALTAEERSGLLNAALANLTSLAPDVLLQVRQVYAHGLRLVFIAFATIGGLCLVFSFLVDEVKFGKDPPHLIQEKERAEADLETGNRASLNDIKLSPASSTKVSLETTSYWVAASAVENPSQVLDSGESVPLHVLEEQVGPSEGIFAKSHETPSSIDQNASMTAYFTTDHHSASRAHPHQMESLKSWHRQAA
ncbi:hypothetical protein P7C73_g3033, partial [Tremellales sp. Uapishka_1]